MKNLLTVILIIGACLFPLKVKAEYDLSRYFPLDQGNIWVYEAVYSGGRDTGIFEEEVRIDGVKVIDGQNTVKVFTHKASFNIVRSSICDYLAIDPEGVKLFQREELGTSVEVKRIEPFSVILPAQMEIGNAAEYSYSTEVEELPASCVRKIILLGNEDITLKTGEFKDCLRFSSIETLQILGGRGKAIENSKIWFAPNIGIVKEVRLVDYIDSDGAIGRTESMEKELKSAVIAGVKIGEDAKAEVGEEEMTGGQEEPVEERQVKEGERL